MRHCSECFGEKLSHGMNKHVERVFSAEANAAAPGVVAADPPNCFEAGTEDMHEATSNAGLFNVLNHPDFGIPTEGWMRVRYDSECI
jgi:hypothetical protein